MERIKKNEAGPATILPQAEGWAIWRGSKREHIAASLAEAAALLPSRLPVHLALPAQGLVIERLQLPATQPDELAGRIEGVLVGAAGDEGVGGIERLEAHRVQVGLG